MGWEQGAQEGFKDVEQLLWARELIIGCKAIDAVRERAAHHRDLAIEALACLPESESKEALVVLAHYLTEANQNRLQRVHYDAEGGYRHPTPVEPKSGTQLKRVLKDAKKGAEMNLFSMRQKFEVIKSQVPLPPPSRPLSSLCLCGEGGGAVVRSVLATHGSNESEEMSDM